LWAARAFPGVSKRTLRLWLIKLVVEPIEEGDRKVVKFEPVTIVREIRPERNPRHR
jgi:hypothetical protein